ncbi:MAG: hypothetical protein IJS58_01465 [Bacilli bacterium]|nr:hypothetical protein [Bacilli bacterium]
MAYKTNTNTVSSMYYSVNPVYGSESDSVLSVAATAPDKMTIKEILAKWFNNEIGDGFRFKYDDVEFVIDEKQIRSVEKFHRYDYGDGEYEDLFEWIDTDNLDETVKITQYVYRLTISENTTCEDDDEEENKKMDDALPQHTCSLPSNSWGYREVRCCPVCGGNGIVSNGFYNHTGNTWVTSTTVPEQCRSCHGKGYVEI